VQHLSDRADDTNVLDGFEIMGGEADQTRLKTTELLVVSCHVVENG
jgi:hypothetical protein